MSHFILSNTIKTNVICFIRNQHLLYPSWCSHPMTFCNLLHSKTNESQMMVDCNTPLRSRVLKEYPGVRLYFLSILSQIIPVENNLKQLLWEQIKKHKGKKWFLDFLFFGHTLSDIMQKKKLQNDSSFFHRYQICNGTSQTKNTKNRYIHKGEEQTLRTSPHK